MKRRTKPLNLPAASLATLMLAILGNQPANADYKSEVLADGPIAYLRFSESVPVASRSYLTNSGSSALAGQGLYSGSETQMKQKPGVLTGDAAARFNGADQYASVATASPVNLNPPFTVEAWVNPETERAAGGVVCPVGSLYRSGSNAKGWLFYQDSDGWNYRHGDSLGYKVNLKAGGTPVIGRWYHLVATFDGTETKFYVNGQLGATSTTAGFEPNTDVPMGIGARGDGAFWFQGSVDEVAIYGSVLPAATVLAHYEGATANPAGYSAQVLAGNPVAYYRLNEPVYQFPKAANEGVLGSAADGSYRADATSTPGPQPPNYPGFEANNAAVNLDGTNGFVRIPADGNLSGDRLKSVREATILCWVRPPASPQGGYKGLVGKRPLSDGLYLSNDALNYSWNDAGNTWGFDSTMIPPGDNWSFAAIVVRPENATFYMQTLGGEMASIVNTVTHNPADFTSGPFAVGTDINFGGNTRYFQGAIDEAAIFDKALPEGRLRTYFLAASGAAVAPAFVAPGTAIVTPAGPIYTTTTFQLSADAYGTPPLTYQWRKGGVDIPGATLVTYVKTNASASDAGQYDVVVQNAHGSSTNLPVTITIDPAVPPTITQQPLSTTAYEGYNATFTVAATGTTPFFYQWRFKGTNLAGRTNATLVLTNITQADAGDYAVRVSNVAGFADSQPAILSIRSLTPGSYEETVVRLRPVAYWRLNEQNGVFTAQDTVGGYHATESPSVVNGVPGPRPPTFPGLEANNTGAALNGTDTEISSGASLVSNRGQFTILGWFRPTGAQPAASGRVGLFGQNDVAEFGYHGLGTVGIWTPNGGFASTGSSIIRNNEWNFITATADGQRLTLYMNGRQVAQAQATTANYGSSTFPFNIGYAVLDSSGNYFLGDVDEVAFFDRALTASEILELNNKATGVEFKIQETTSNDVVRDVKPSGTPHDGFNNGAVWLASSTDGAGVKRDGVMQFNPTNGPTQVVIPYSGDFNSAEGTMTFWLRSGGNTDTNGNDGAMLIDRRTSIGDVIVLMDDGTLFWQPNWIYGQNSLAVVNDGNWHHVAYVYDQIDTVALFIDGVADASHSDPTVWNWPAAPVELGLSHDAYWRAFDGMLDDFRIYNRKLTEQEIGQIRAGDSAALVGAANLVGRYSFDVEPSGLRIVLTWDLGVLESAPSPQGPWSTVQGAASPYSITTPLGNQFYRLRL